MNEDELIQKAMPDRYDLMKITIFIIIIAGAWFLGYSMKDTYVCKIWLGDQLRMYQINETNPIVMWDYFNITRNITTS